MFIESRRRQTNGALVTVGQPCALPISSPSSSDCAAEIIACKPDPQRRLTLKAGVAWPMPALMAATLDKYMSRGSVLMTWPTATWPTSAPATPRSEEHTSELQSLMRISYAVFCLKKKKNNKTTKHN